MPSSAQWVLVCQPGATTGAAVLYGRPPSGTTCITGDGQAGVPVAVKAYLSDQPSPFEMTAEDGAVASGLIVSCWITAFALRSVISIFRGSKNDA